MLTESQIIALIADLPCSKKNLVAGDDIARFKSGPSAYAASDSVIENVHFRHAWVSPAGIAHKLFARNWSDFLCKGIKPAHALLNLALSPQSAAAEFIIPFLKKLNALLLKYRITLIGGDTARSATDVLTLTFLGSAGNFIPRSGMGIRKGDLVLQLGGVGGSEFARKLLESEHGCPPRYRKFFTAPNIFAALPGAKRLKAAIDQSDSVDKSLRLLAEANAVTLAIQIEQIAASHPQIRKAASYPGNLLEAAEDLAVFAIGESSAAFRVIGSVESIHVKKSAVHYRFAGRPFQPQTHGFEHFGSD